MHPFEYLTVQDEKTASTTGAVAGGAPGALTNPARFLAGGTSLIDLIKLNVETPSHLVDLSPLPLTKIEPMANGGLSVGALVTNADMAHDPAIIANYPFVSQAILQGASPQLRNMATTAGNILQRTRCYYYRDTATPCNKREPGSGCPAIGGYNRILAVLGTSKECIASHPSDMCVPLAALNATIVTSGPQGVRRIRFTDFHVEPGDHPERENILLPGEIITAVELPPLPFAAKSHYLKVRDRASYAFALTSAAVALDMSGGTIKEARIALGGVGTKPWRAFEAEKALAGKAPTAENFRAAAEAEMKPAKGYKDNSFKIELAKRTLVRCLTTVSEMS
ncbi:MAG: FAD binding domain-containing protein [Janthinobacterium lividum]